MKRDKAFWGRLTHEERSELVMLERTKGLGGHKSYYPDDCVECTGCGNPSMGGLCNTCFSRYSDLINKAEGK